jgi:GT2 family glycosyltransferase
MTFGCVVLTTGKRPESLRAGVESLLGQRGVEVDVVVAGNGWEPADLPAGARGVAKAEDTGIAAGRNFGAAHARGELLFFLDDDAALASDDALARLAALFAADPALGMVQPRVDALEGAPAREWVPRLRSADRLRSGDVTHVWEGALAVRREAFDAAGGWPEDFRLVHEGVELGWRVMDAGYRVHYAAEVAALHPPYAGSVHNEWDYYYGARNRMWLARRHLPAPFAVPFVLAFVARTLPHLDNRRKRQAALRGYRDGFREPGPRQRLRARTLWRMTRLGRPPVL